MKTYTWTEFCLHLHKNGPLQVELTETHNLMTTRCKCSVIAKEPSLKRIALLGHLAPCKATVYLGINSYYLRDETDVEKIILSDHHEIENLSDCLDIFITPEGSVVSYMISGVKNSRNIVLQSKEAVVNQETRPNIQCLRELFHIIKASAV